MNGIKNHILENGEVVFATPEDNWHIIWRLRKGKDVEVHLLQYENVGIDVVMQNLTDISSIV